MSNYIVNSSLNVQNMPQHDFTVERRTVQRVSDNNNQNYAANSCVFDLATIANGNSFPSFAESVLTIPYLITVTRDIPASTTYVNNIKHQYLASLKNGNHSLIDGMNIYLSNMPVQNYTKGAFGHISYELASTWSQDDYNRGSEWGLAVQDKGLFSYSATADSVASPKLMVASTCVKQISDMTVVNDADAKYVALKASDWKTQDETSRYSENAAGTVCTFQIIARISLSHLDDWFRKCPISKNSLYRFEFYINKADFTVTAGSSKYSGVSAMSTSYGFNPIQLGSWDDWYSVGTAAVAASTGVPAVAATGDGASTTFTVTTKIAGDAVPNYPTCTLDIPMYDLSPESEKLYFATPEKYFNYDKIQFQKIGPIASNGYANNVVITSGLSRARKMVILPFYDYATVAAGITCSDLTSPFTNFACGQLSSSLAAVSEFNVNISGQPLFQRALKTPSDFYNEFKRQTLNNGIDSSILNTSVVDLDRFRKNSGAIVVDLTMNSKEKDDDLAKSYSVYFKNTSVLPCSYMVYIYYEQRMGINTETGQIILPGGY
jgi:hypothetical protein